MVYAVQNRISDNFPVKLALLSWQNRAWDGLREPWCGRA